MTKIKALERLKSLKIENYKSIKEKHTFTFENGVTGAATSQGVDPQVLLDAIDFLCKFTLQVGDKKHLKDDCLFSNESLKCKATSFEIDFLADNDINYTYSLSLYRDAVLDESIIFFDKKNPSPCSLFTRAINLHKIYSKRLKTDSIELVETSQSVVPFLTRANNVFGDDMYFICKYFYNLILSDNKSNSMKSKIQIEDTVYNFVEWISWNIF